jgi:predicted DNA-binding transcriptional regulator YafY
MHPADFAACLLIFLRQKADIGKRLRSHFQRRCSALQEGFDVLDDEAARLFSNTLRRDTDYLSDQGPPLQGGNGFVRKIKPL